MDRGMEMGMGRGIEDSRSTSAGTVRARARSMQGRTRTRTGTGMHIWAQTPCALGVWGARPFIVLDARFLVVGPWTRPLGSSGRGQY